MKKWIAVLVICCALPAIAQEPDAAVHNALRALKARLVDAINRNDIDAILAELHPNVVVTWQNAEVSHGRDQVRAYLERTTRGPNPIVNRYHA
ncbi:MAG TPA: nuclear transport factor 2 family protein, partial [Thermoanaerobaculia bacterium]|nr:nuclear transport factor 2 family protein [Thermoanaerobaculia bacterium]